MGAPRDLAVLGMGVVCAAGRGVDALWRSALAARPLARPVTRYEVEGCRTRQAAIIDDALLGSLRARWGGDPVIAISLEAAREALGGNEIHPESAVLVGTSLGGVGEWEGWHRALVGGRSLTPPACATHDDLAPILAARLGARGPALTVSTACTSASSALILAADMLRAGECEEALVLGVDVLGAFVHVGFDRLGALAPDDAPPAPFALDRGGLWLGEGCAAIRLGRGPGLAKYLGGASALDGVHMTAPDREGGGLRRAVEGALRDAACTRDQVAWVSAHATATRYNDAMEASALRAVFGDAIPAVHALKPVTGHTLGASGLLEAVVAVCALRESTRPPTATRALDPALSGLRLDARASRMRGAVALSVNAAMAGHNTALLLGRATWRR